MQALRMSQIKKSLLINPFYCSNHERLLFLVSKETFAKSGFSPDGRRWG